MPCSICQTYSELPPFKPGPAELSSLQYTFTEPKHLLQRDMYSILRVRESDREPGKVSPSHYNTTHTQYLRREKEIQREQFSLSNLRRLCAEPRSFRLDYESVRGATVNRLLFLHIMLYCSCWMNSFTCGHPSPRLLAQMDVM